MTLLRITAPHFCAGIEPNRRAAPILAWMLGKGWDAEKVRGYCKAKGWTVEEVNMDVRRRRGEGKPDLMAAEEILHVTSIYGGEERNRTERLSVRKFKVEPAYVRVNAGMTKNMGNYESLRLDVSLSVPCYTEEIDKAFLVIADKVSVFLEEELKNYE